MVPNHTSTMPLVHHFCVCAFGCNILVSTSCLESHEILERYVFPSFARTASTVRPDIAVRVFLVADQFQLSIDDTVVASASRAIRLVPPLIRALDDVIIPRLMTMRAVHAGVVLLGGRAVLLPGPTHTGKSSLVSELLRCGATYFSDEYALIDCDGWVHSYPRPLLLRDGTDSFPMLPAECNPATVHAAVPVGWILSLVYRPASVWSLTAVPQSHALLTLLQNTPHVLAESTDMMAAFQRTVAGAACYAGSRAEAADAAAEILRLVGNSA